MANKLALVILDGWGIGDHSSSDAIYNAHTPTMDYLLTNFPNSALITYGEAVGLPPGQMGNSEVGHLNLGAGRVVYQELTRINKSIEDGSFFENTALLSALSYAKENRKKVHLMGLVSQGGVHSSLVHLEALIKLCNQYNVDKTYLHAFTDGRDCSPTTAVNDIAYLLSLENERIHLATLIGRYYAMDRDNRWERIAKSYDLMVHGKGEPSFDAIATLKSYYSQGITDEFLPGILLDENGLIGSGDVVISFNFRTDRPREITQALTQKAFPEYGMAPLSLKYLTMTPYDDTFQAIEVVFKKENLGCTLGEILSSRGLRQVRVAETEKYPHVTYFFNGGREVPFPLEDRIMVPSPKVATYDLKPEMSAFEVTNELLAYAEKKHPNFICVNYANPDMVGHTGEYTAIVKAVETIDHEVKRLVDKLSTLEYVILILADHGNADFAINPDGTPNTSHSLNPVPCILVNSSKNDSLKDGVLADIAPTILALLGVEQPTEMTGKSLIKKGV